MTRKVIHKTIWEIVGEDYSVIYPDYVLRIINDLAEMAEEGEAQRQLARRLALALVTEYNETIEAE